MIVVSIAAAAVVWSGIVFPPALAVYALLKWHGWWRFLASAPLVVIVGFFAPLIPAWLRDSPAYSLWGLLFVPLGMLLAVYSGMVLILYRRRLAR